MDRIFYDNQEYAKYSDKFLKRFNLADQAAYDALPAATKNDDSKVFFIPDVPEHDYLYKWNFKKSLTDEIANVTAVLSGNASLTPGTGITINGADGKILLKSMNMDYRTIEIDISYMNKNYTGRHGRLIVCSNQSGSSDQGRGFIYRDNGANTEWEVYGGSPTSSSWQRFTKTSNVANVFNNKTIKLVSTLNNNLKVFANEELIYEGGNMYGANGAAYYISIGAASQSFNDIIVTGCRVYSNLEE